MHSKTFRLLAIGLAAILAGCATPADNKPAVVTLSSVTLPSATLLLPGGSKSIAATAHFSDGSTAAVTDAVWTSTDPTVATVTAGTITSVKAGTTTVKATKGGLEASVAVTVATPFRNPAYTYSAEGATAAGSETFLLGTAGGTGSIAVSGAAATGTFASYPAWWDGMLSWGQKPAAALGYYDLSGVAKIQFKVKSATITAGQLAVFIQWLGTGNNGGEFTVPLSTLGVGTMTDWVTVDVDVTAAGAVIPDTTNTTGRYGKDAVSFFTGQGNKYVDTPLSLKWYGSAGKDPNTGPLAAGATYDISDIAFLDASGAQVDIAQGIFYAPDPTVAAPVPTVDAAKASVLLSSQGSYTLKTVDTWSTNWGSAQAVDLKIGSASNAVKKYVGLGFAGVEFTDTHAIDATTQKFFHADIYIASAGKRLELKVVDLGAGTKEALIVLDTTGKSGQWISVDEDLSNATKYAGLTARNSIQQLVIGGGSGDQPVICLDNVYFHE